jgi:hypothetical protein
MTEQSTVVIRLLAFRGGPSDTTECFNGLRIEAADELKRLRAELAACKEDAERYRWLLLNAVREKPLGDKYIEFHCDFETWNDISAAIDAARREP